MDQTCTVFSPFNRRISCIPRLFFVVPVVAVGRLLGSLNGAAVGFGLEELVRSAQDGFGRRFWDDASGRAEVRGDFDQVAGDDGDARLEVVKEFVGQAPAVVLALGLSRENPRWAA